MLSVVATLLPQPFQKIAMYFSLETQQPPQQLTFETLETVSQASLTVQDDNTIIFTATQVLFGSLHNPSNSGSHVFPHHPSGSRNVLKMF